ncbi:hypothetical protein [Desulfatitalea tepidiphila]|uniref:hypothetical protein n=1 Tax=Desulfatitalea tepidiphila TaxID=1185843 RepID=UPI000AFE482C|nr:hypothetical protein [Desulfatitalea tepidiphila]
MANFDIDEVEEGLLGFAWDNLSPIVRAKALENSKKTSWIFGAGASHHYDLNSRGVPVPLANSFFEAFHNLPTSEGLHAFVGPFISFLNHYRGINPREVGSWSEDVELFMTTIEDELNELMTKAKNMELKEDETLKLYSLAGVFTNMTFIFANVLNEAQNGPSPSAYHFLLKFCSPNDTFITFNWDTLIDRALADTGGWDPNVGYGLKFHSSFDSSWKLNIESSPSFNANWKLLKLHGSTNWLVPYTSIRFDKWEMQPLVENSDEVFLFWQSSLPYDTFKGRWRGGYVPTCYGYYPPNLPNDAFDEKRLSAPPGKVFISSSLTGIYSPAKEQRATGIPSSPLLITPVRQKKYDMYQKTIEQLWEQAEGALIESDRIVIIGYSFPATDKRSLTLIKECLEKRADRITLEIVAPDAEGIVSRLGNEYFKKAENVVPISMRFEDYISMLWKNSPTLMKSAARQDKNIKDWLYRIYLLNNIS